MTRRFSSPMYTVLYILMILTFLGCKDLETEQSKSNPSGAKETSSVLAQSQSENKLIREINKGLGKVQPMLAPGIKPANKGKFSEEQLAKMRQRSVLRDLAFRMKKAKAGSKKKDQAQPTQRMKFPNGTKGPKHRVSPKGVSKSASYESLDLRFGYDDGPYEEMRTWDSRPVLWHTYRAPYGTDTMSVAIDFIDLEPDYDFLFIYEADGTLCQSFTGYHPFPQWSNWCYGDTLHFYIYTDSSMNDYGGFYLSEVETRSSYNLPPTAIATISPTVLTEGQSVYFYAGYSSDLDDSSLSYAWYINGAEWPESEQVAFSKTFWDAGYYNIELVVTDPWGNSDYAYELIEVQESSTDLFPDAYLTLDPDPFYGPIDLDTYLQGTGSGSQSNVPFFYDLRQSIDWGDYTDKSESDDIDDWLGHYYDYAGTYYVILTVENSLGLTDRDMKAVEVTIPVYRPSISGISPMSGKENDWITINGSDFASVTEVAFNGMSASFTLGTADSSGNVFQIYARVPVGATSGVISVTNSMGSALSPKFTVAPIIVELSPNVGPVGSLISIVGRNLETVTKVKIGNVEFQNPVIGSGTIGAMIPDGAIGGPITLISPLFTVYSSGMFGVTPKVNSFSPTSGSPGSDILISGKTFRDATTVKLGNLPLDIKSIAETEIRATIPLSAEFSGVITVENSYGAGSSASQFVITLPKPVIDTFEPQSGPEEFPVTITGAHFKNVTGVRFGGILTGDFDVNESMNQITVRVPIDAVDGPITVVTLNDEVSSSGLFRVTYLAPMITSFSPSSAAPGTEIQIGGDNLRHATSVLFNGVAASFDLKRSTKTALVATVPEGATSGPVTVKTKGGNVTSQATFIVKGHAPVVYSMDKTKGPVGTVVELKGAYLAGATVTFQKLSVEVISNKGGTLRVKVPSSAKTGKKKADVFTIRTAAGVDYSPSKFKVTKK